MVITLNGTAVENDMGMFPYKSIIPLLLTTGTDEETSLLTAALAYRDTEYDVNDPATNLGFKKRLELSKESKIFDMVGPIASALFQQTRYIPPGVAIEIRMIRSPPEFCLQSSTQSKTGVSGVPYIYSIEECQLFLKSNTIRHDILRHHQTMFAKGAVAQYPVTQYDPRVSQIAKGSTTFLTEMLWSGKLPQYCIFALVEPAAYNGQLNLSPFNFKDHGLSAITLKCDHDSIVYQTINVDYTLGNFQLGFHSIADCLGNRISGNAIPRDLYPKGYAYYVFHLLPTTASGTDLQPERRGSMRVSKIFYTLFRFDTKRSVKYIIIDFLLKAELQFKSPTAGPLNCIALGVFQNIIQINRDRNVHVL